MRCGDGDQTKDFPPVEKSQNESPRLLLAFNFFEWELKMINIHFCYVRVTRILFSTSQDFERFAG